MHGGDNVCFAVVYSNVATSSTAWGGNYRVPRPSGTIPSSGLGSGLCRWRARLLGTTFTFCDRLGLDRALFLEAGSFFCRLLFQLVVPDSPSLSTCKKKAPRLLSAFRIPATAAAAASTDSRTKTAGKGVGTPAHYLPL